MTKPPILGLVDRKGAVVAGYDAVVAGAVANVDWKDLQAAPNGALQVAGTDQIDALLADAAARGYKAKIRMTAGVAAPDFAKTVGGFVPLGLISTAIPAVTISGVTAVPVYLDNSVATPIDTIVFNPADGKLYKSKIAVPAGNPPPNGTYWSAGTTNTSAGTVGPVWRGDYLDLYADVMTRLSDRYDAHPLVREVTISAGMTVFEETNVRHTSGVTNLAVGNANGLIGRGFDLETDVGAHHRAMEIHAAAWPTTVQSMAFNLYDRTVLGGGGGNAEAALTPYLSRMVAHLCHVLGDRALPGNHSPRDTTNPLTFQYPLYFILGAHAPLYLQTASPIVLNSSPAGALPRVLGLCVGFGAVNVELPLITGMRESYDSYPPDTFAPFAALLAKRSIVRARVPAVPPPNIKGLT